ncbi:RAD50-interacting protein 1 isoform X2 [Aplysia californica]|nr:RAD50-interacting protein 1 isoform X2 [Aplysia californica]
MLGELGALVESVEQLQRHAYYLSTVAKVEDISSQIQSSLMTESLSPAVDYFNEMTALYNKLLTSSCPHLLHYLKETIMFWNKILCDRIAVEFEEVLKALRWPLVISTVKAPAVSNVAGLKDRMGKLFRKLLSLQLPDSISLENSASHPLLRKISGVKPLLLPLELMLKPLKKRFRYHFYGQKQTNSLDKPEWYLTQVLSWTRDHSDFMDRNIQPLLVEAGKESLCAKTELTRGMVMMVMEKIAHDLPELVHDEAKFSHLIDEVLLFESEIRNTYSYPPVLPGCLDVLCSQEALTKWLLVEKKYAMQKTEQLLQSVTAWESQYRDIADLDEVKVPECAESFMNLLLTITERYRRLPVSEAKLQFLSVQLELLEDFRMRLVQVRKEASQEPTGQRFCAVLNATHYVVQVLREWSELTFFLQLLCYKNNRNLKTEVIESLTATDHKRTSSDSDSSDVPVPDLSGLSLEHTVFEEITCLFESMETDMIKTACHYVFVDVQARSQAYRKDRWISLPTPKELSTTLGLSPTACEMFLVLKDHLATAQSQMSAQLFQTFWKTLAKKLDNFILTEVILVNHFNEGGALQINFDITRNLIPLFGDFTNNPEAYFRLSREACILLTLPTGSALLLKEVLYSKLHESLEQQQLRQQPEVSTAMRDVGVFTLVPEQCETVLSLRTNLTLS